MSDVLNRIKQGQDLKAMNKRLIENAIMLYAEKTHFVYELLQNAEDVCATHVCFNQYPDRLEVLHDGTPFTESNLTSLCDAANSDKIEENGKIGKFGIGFKSVFAICNTVMLYSEPHHRPAKNALPRIAVSIENYIDPDYIEEEWKLESPYTTKFIFPYDVSLYGKSEDVLRVDIARKLRNLGADVLLFMKHIKQVEYNINDIGDEYNGGSIYMLDRQVLGERISKVTTIGETDNKPNDSSYIVFSKTIADSERTVDIAFSIKEKDGNIRFLKSASSNISTYFPTETNSNLHFIVQAPFDLTPNRSNLKSDSDHNKEMIKLLSELFVEAVFEIKDRKWLSLEFVDILPYDIYNHAYRPDWHFYSLHTRAYDLLKGEEVIPAADGSYVTALDAKIVRGEKLLELFKGQYLEDFLRQPGAKWLSVELTENSPLRDLHAFLINELDVQEIESNDLPSLIRSNPAFMSAVSNSWLESFYNYLAHDVKSLLGQNGNMATVPFVKTSDGKINAPFTSKKVGRTSEITPNIFRKPKDSHYDVEGFLFVDDYFEKGCPDFVTKLGLPVPDEFDYFIKELEAGKNSTVNNEINVEHVKQAAYYLRAGKEKAVEMLSGLLKMRVIRASDNKRFYATSSSRIYRVKDKYGESIREYFYGVDLPGGSETVYILDEDYYLSKELTVSEFNDLEHLGIKNNIYVNLDEIEWREGNVNCKNLGVFKKHLSFIHISSVLKSIESDYRSKNTERVKRKSDTLFKMTKNVEKNLSGEYQYGSTRPEIYEEVSDIAYVLSEGLYGSGKKSWLLTKKGSLVNPTSISRFDLDEALYGKVDRRTYIYEILGFKKTEEDKQEEIVKEFLSQYDEKQREIIIKNLLQEEDEDIYDPDVDEEYIGFPEDPVKNLTRLHSNIRQRYTEAPKVTYEKVYRQIRTSRGRDKEHIKYRYNGYCQMCEEPSQYWEIAEIFSMPYKELEEMNLSLCPTCASEYRILRNDKEKMLKFAHEITGTNIVSEPCVALGGKFIRFTSTHLAEVQEVVRLDRANKKL